MLNVTNQTNIYCHKLNKNQKFIKVKKEILNENSSTISKIFDILVNFKFSSNFTHNISDEDLVNLNTSININDKLVDGEICDLPIV